MDRTAGGRAAVIAWDRFDDVVARHRRGVILAAYRITQNVDDARDVAQHVFTQMFCKQPAFFSQAHVDRWLYVVTRNAALSIQRRRQRDVAAEGSCTDVVPLGLEDTVLQNERSRQVRATIAQLPSAERRIVELRYLHSLSMNEIAASSGISVERVKRDLERATRRLRYELLRVGMVEDF